MKGKLMTDAELDRINTERRRKGLPPLSRLQATSAVVASPQRYDDGFSTTDFLIGYTTGIPLPSTGGIVGSMLHQSSPSAPDPSPSQDSGPSYDSGGSPGGGDGGGSDGGGGGGE